MAPTHHQIYASTHRALRTGFVCKAKRIYYFSTLIISMFVTRPSPHSSTDLFSELHFSANVNLQHLILPFLTVASFSSRPTSYFDRPDFVCIILVLMHCSTILLHYYFIVFLCSHFLSIPFFGCVLVHWETPDLAKQAFCQNSQSSCPTGWFVPELSRSFL